MTKTRDLSDFLIEGGADLPLGKPHIVPDVLYPAVGGNDINGTDIDTSHGSTYTYGELHTDGRKYYYTDIKGSKPIKDPRIGAHFGSQRHKFKSLQLLEQETATHGDDVASVDGREWIRTSGKIGGSSDPVYYRYDAHGTSIMLYRNGTGFFEITGYFNDINFLNYTSANRGIQYYLDGGSANGTNLGTTTAGTPLNNRYVDAGSLVNLGLSTNLGIHTIKIKSSTSDDTIIYGIELIAQDTSNRSNIQIPSQNVVSFGKKFNVSGTPHYDPFNGFTSGSSVSSYVDTATSLGLDKWLHSSNYYRPYNGGRVVKWVDSSGTIKTSVTVMPPNAKSIADSSSLTNATAKANASASNDTFYPTFEAHTTDVNEDNLHEVAKTFHWREFGNGSANGGTGATYADASMLTTSDNIAYVMDDGLTSFFAQNGSTRNSLDFEPNSNNTNNDHNAYFTFIGTGLTLTATQNGAQTTTVVQNLPYGTHVYNHFYQADSHAEGKIDGVALGDTMNGTYGDLSEVSFHQPKRPPIPEDACVLADYMLMADWVNSDSGAIGTIPKGAREVSPSRDLFYDSDGSLEHFYSGNYSSGWFFGDGGTEATINTNFAELPVFGTRFHVIGYDMDTRSDLYVDGSIATSSGTTGGNHSTYLRLTNPESNLGVHKFRVANKANGRITFGNFFVDSPIHTSFHYQSFETPLLHELVGGDRNMEQTNLVCSPDGKTWDEVTRDTSYIGEGVLLTNASDPYGGDTMAHENDNWRGTTNNKKYHNKNSFAIAQDRIICLEDGQYLLHFQTYRNEGGDRDIWLNGSVISRAYQFYAGTATTSIITSLKRGDYLQTVGRQTVNQAVNHFMIKKL